jgi:hypothetical protein
VLTEAIRLAKEAAAATRDGGTAPSGPG